MLISVVLRVVVLRRGVEALSWDVVALCGSVKALSGGVESLSWDVALSGGGSWELAG